MERIEEQDIQMLAPRCPIREAIEGADTCLVLVTDPGEHALRVAREAVNASREKGSICFVLTSIQIELNGELEALASSGGLVTMPGSNPEDLGELALMMIRGFVGLGSCHIDYADIKKILLDRTLRWNIVRARCDRSGLSKIGKEVSEKISLLQPSDLVWIFYSEGMMGSEELRSVLTDIQSGLDEECEIILGSFPLSAESCLLEIDVLCSSG